MPAPITLGSALRCAVSATRVQVGGQSLTVWRAGTRRPVLLLHGIPTSSLLWRHVQPGLSAHAPTMAVDMLGYGDSDKPESPLPTLPVQAELLDELLRLWDLHDVLVVGHDIGGGVAQLLALRAPDRVTGLVLVDSIAYDSFPEPGIARLQDPPWDQGIQQIDLAAGFRRSFSKGLADRLAVDARHIADLHAAAFEGADGRAAYLFVSPLMSDVITVTPGFGPLPAIYLPTAPAPGSPTRAGRGGSARLTAPASRVARLFIGVRHNRAFQGES